MTPDPGAVAVLLPLAHAGEGATWQALLTLLALGIVAVVLLVAAGVVDVDEPGDLVLPFAGVAVLASLSGPTSAVVSDWVGWAVPAGVVALAVLVVAVASPLALRPSSPLLWGGVVLAAGAALALHEPLTVAWHPPPDAVATAPVDDIRVRIVSPEEEATVPSGPTEVVLEVTGGTLGAGFLPEGEPGPDDPERLVVGRLFVDGLLAGTGDEVVGPQQDCRQGCTRATYVVDLGPGQHTLLADLMTADARPFAAAGGADQPTTDRVTVTAD